MALTLTFSFTGKTIDGETLTFTDTTTYSDPARNTLALIMRISHLDQDDTHTRKEFNAYDPLTATTWTVDITATPPIDGVHKVELFALTSDKYGGLSGGKHQIDSGSGMVDEDTLTDAELTALSEDTKFAMILPLPKHIQEETNIIKNLSDHDIDIDIPSLNEQYIALFSKRVGAQSQFQQSNYTSAARILEIE